MAASRTCSCHTIDGGRCLRHDPVAFSRARCVGRLIAGRVRACGWEGAVQRGPLDKAPACPGCGGMTEPIGAGRLALASGQKGELECPR